MRYSEQQKIEEGSTWMDVDSRYQWVYRVLGFLYLQCENKEMAGVCCVRYINAVEESIHPGSQDEFCQPFEEFKRRNWVRVSYDHGKIAFLADKMKPVLVEKSYWRWELDN